MAERPLSDDQSTIVDSLVENGGVTPITGSAVLVGSGGMSFADGGAGVINVDGTNIKTPLTFNVGRIYSSASVPDTRVTVEPFSVADTTNAVNITTTSTKTINASGTGINALDTGALAADTWYAIYGIATVGGTTNTLLSTNFTTPSLPGGYTYYRRIGAVRTANTAIFRRFTQDGEVVVYRSQPQSPPSNVNVTDHQNLTIATSFAPYLMYDDSVPAVQLIPKTAFSAFVGFAARKFGTEAPGDSIGEVFIKPGVAVGSTGGLQVVGLNNVFNTGGSSSQYTSVYMELRVGASGSDLVFSARRSAGDIRILDIYVLGYRDILI